MELELGDLQLWLIHTIHPINPPPYTPSQPTFSTNPLNQPSQPTLLSTLPTYLINPVNTPSLSLGDLQLDSYSETAAQPVLLYAIRNPPQVTPLILLLHITPSPTYIIPVLHITLALVLYATLTLTPLRDPPGSTAIYYP